MYTIQGINDGLQRTTRLLALGLVVFGVAFLLACSSEQATPTREPQPTEVPQPTATPTSAQPTATPTSTDFATPTPSKPPIQVVATSNIVADWAKVIGGDRVEVFSLHPPGGDPHNIVPGAGDVAKVADADIVLSIGLGLETAWLEDLVHNASADESRVVALGEGVDPLEFMEMGGHGHDDLDAEFLEELRHVLHEVEDGHISAEQGLKEIEELLENFKHHAEGEEPQGPADLVHELLLQFVRGEIDAEKAIEEVEHIAEGEDMHDDHGHEGEFLEELRDILHEVEDGHITAEQGLEEIEELLEGMDHHGEQEEAVHDIVHQFEDGQIDAEKAIEEIEHIAEGEDMHDDHGHEGHDHGPLDPHFWFDPNRVKIAVNDIAALFSALDPDNIGVYIANALEYGRQLDELHVWIQEQVSVVPPERRLLVTSHDTFAYFADVYEFEVIGALIPSLAPDVEPSAEHLAELVEVIREHNAPAVFSETTVSGRLPEALARETGASLFQLYADSLGEQDSPAGTYLGMMRANVEVLVEALN